MATVSTTTATSRRLDYPAHSAMGRFIGYTDLFLFMRTAATTYAVFKSEDGGLSWIAKATFTRSNLIEWSSFKLDGSGYAYLAYRVSDASTDRVYFRRYNANENLWEAELQVSGDGSSGTPNSGVPGSVIQGVDLAMYRNANYSYSIAVLYAYSYSTNYGVISCGVTIPTSGSAYLNNSLITGARTLAFSGTAPGRSGVTLEAEHNGDGFTTSAPNLWITWGRTKLYLAKFAWNGSTWAGLSTAVTIDSSQPAADAVPGRWDGVRFLMAAVNSTNSATIDLFERNKANTSTTVRTSPVHPTGAVRAHSLSYDSTTKNPRLYAVGTTTAVLYSVDFVRATSTWGSWVSVTADAITSNTVPDEFSPRLGGNSGNSQFDVAYTTGSVTPWTVKNTAQGVQYAPSTPTWVTSTQPYENGGAADVGAALTLDWQFNDPNDTQASYVLRRQIGAGALSYWNAGTTTWGASEVFNASGTSAVTLASGWGLDADATHQYAVKTRDSGALDSPYSSVLSLTPSAKVNPAVTAPAAAAVLTAASVTVTWTAAQQKQFRVRLLSGANAVHDSGYVSEPSTLSYTVPYELPDNTAWSIELTTTNNEGLASTPQTRAFTVDFIEPATPTLVATPVPASGWISVVITNPTPSGGQPALASQSLYRRVVGSTDAVGVKVREQLPTGATVQDWRAAARVAYEYRVAAYGTNGTLKSSAWTP